jgi:Cu/Ag efflux protein CusF
MKTKQSNAMSLVIAAFLGSALSFACVAPAFGDDSMAPEPKPSTKQDKLFAGTVSQVDAAGKVLIVKTFWSTRTFSVSDTCKVALEDKPEAALADLQPGQNIRIHYRDAHGVKIAHEILQQNLVYHGHIESIDAANKTVGVKRGGSTRSFTLPEHFTVRVKDNKSGSLEDLKIGQTVDVIYEPHGDSCYLARRIEQKHPTFVGTIRSLDAATRTVKAKNFCDEKQFRLADGCRIVTADNPNAALRDLRIGDRVEFVYEDKDGVLIANRIGQESSPAAAVGSETAKADTKVP